MKSMALSLAIVLLAVSAAVAANWPAPSGPSMPGSLGYTKLPNAAYNPDPKQSYKIVFDVTRGAAKPTEASMGIALAATELDQLRGHGVPKANIKLALIFHDGAIDSILNDAAYKAKHGVSNPNLPALAALKSEGAELLVCGQNLVIENIDPATLSSDVTLGSDALLMLAAFQNKGYALLSF